MVYEHYTVQGLSIGAITRLLNEQGVSTRKGISRWERSTVWAMLRNPAYKGTACFNKTKSSKRERITRPIRLRGGFASRDSANHERPRAEWIEIPLRPIITEETFALNGPGFVNPFLHSRDIRSPGSCCRASSGQ